MTVAILGRVARCTLRQQSRLGRCRTILFPRCRNQLFFQYRYQLKRSFTVLGIESSCDDSSVAILKVPESGDPSLPFHGKVTADTTKFLGINPITAFQSHRRNLSPLIQTAIKHLPDGKRPDIIAVTRGPGMISSLDVGLQTAKGLALAWDVPLVGVNHMQAHALTVRLCRALEGKGPDSPRYPFLSLLVSGGHTMIVVSWGLTEHEILAETIDTAVGDCVDKVARVIVPDKIVKSKKDTNYGKMLEEFAFADYDDNRYEISKIDVVGDQLQERYGWRLPVSLGGAKKEGHRGLMKFSFAGLRSSVDRLVDTRRKTNGDEWADIEERKALSREVMRRCWEHLASRVVITLNKMCEKDVDIKTVVVSGGVASNGFLREVIRKQLDFHEFGAVDVAFPPIEFCTDNAAMIAWTGYEMYQAGYESTMDITPFRKWSLQPLDEAVHDVERSWEENAFGILNVDGWKRRAAPGSKKFLEKNSEAQDEVHPPLRSRRSRQRYLGLLGGVTTLRHTKPMFLAGLDSSTAKPTQKTAFRPQPPPYDILPYHSAQSGASRGSNGIDDQAFWKPFTIRLPYLISLNILTLLFIIVIETLYYYSNRNGGLLFLKDTSNLPATKFFAIQYLPTLVAVLYSICWSIVDVDSKRLEPFYDLSKAGGTDSDALFLEYQYQFSLFVPLRALVKRHWAVFLSSTIFLIATLLLTPLQSSLLATIEAVSALETTFDVTSQFLPLNGSDSALTPEFLFTEYTIARLNGSLPPFTAGGDSFLPIRPSQASFRDTDFTASNWTVTGTSYSLAVECVKPDVVNITLAPSGPQLPFPPFLYSLYHQFEDGVCNITNTFYFDPPSGEGITYYYEWKRPKFKQWCGFKNTTTVATIAYQNDTDGAVGIQSVLCELKGIQEYTQEVVFNAITHAVSERKSARRPGRFYDRGEIDLVPFDAALFYRPAQEVLASDRAVFAAAEIDVPGTLFNGSRPLSTFMDFSNLKDATERTYRYFFSLAVSTSQGYLTASSKQIPGTITTQGQVVVVDRTFATVLDVVLGTVLILGIALAAYSYQRDSGLRSDPDSLFSTMVLVAQSNLPSKFKNLDTERTELLKLRVKDAQVMLREWQDGSGRVIYKLDEVSKSPLSPGNPPGKKIKEEPSPLHMRLKTGLSFLFAHLAGIAFLVYLFLWSKDSGLPVISNNTFVFNIIWAFIPTIIAALLEPMWAGINRDISVFQPFYNLIKRNVPAEKCLSLKYQTIPVILMARSFLAGDFLLSIVSLMVTLVSLLAVTLPGIFLVDIRAVGENAEFKPQIASPIIKTDFWLWNYDLPPGTGTREQKILDPFAVARANISEGIALPAWSTREHAFIPVRPIQGPDTAGNWDFIRVPTIGFRGGMKCRPIINGTNGETIMFHPSNGTTTATFSIPNKYQGKSSELIPCGTVFGYKPPAITETSPNTYNITFGRWPFPSITNPAELFVNNTDADNIEFSFDVRSINSKRETSEEAAESFEREVLCSRILPVAWSSRSYRRVRNEYLIDGSPEETLLICELEFTVANFSVEVDRLGNIRSQEQVGDPINISNYLESGFTETQFSYEATRLFQDIIPDWRTKDWAGLLMTRLAKDTVDYTNSTELGRLADETSALSFSIFVAQNIEDFLQNRDPQAGGQVINGKGFNFLRRVVMSEPLTYISLGILGLFCCTLALIYGFRRRKYLPRQPNCLASIIAYCQESSVLEDFADTWAMSTSQQQKYLEMLGYTYGFGWYQGRDGSKHFGIDKEPLLADYVQ